MIDKCRCPGTPPCEAPNISGGPLCDNCKQCCLHHENAEPYCTKCVEALTAERDAFRAVLEQIADNQATPMTATKLLAREVLHKFRGSEKGG